MEIPKDKFDELIKVPHSYAPANMNRQKASSLGVLAFEYLRKGLTESAFDHKPEYLRLSQAERERMERQ